MKVGPFIRRITRFEMPLFTRRQRYAYSQFYIANPYFREIFYENFESIREKYKEILNLH